MADRHTIIVRVKEGAVTEVVFCACCPGLTLEVRTYTDDPQAAEIAKASPEIGGQAWPGPELWRDEDGVYAAAYFEPEDEEE